MLGTGCIADPWPEPDSTEELAGANDWNDSDYEPPDVPGDTAGGEEAPDAGGSRTDVLIHQVYCSAPGETGIATVVGLAGTFPPRSDVMIQSQNDAVFREAGQDGGLAARIEASPGELLRLRISPRDGPETTQSIFAGTLEEGSVGTAILGAGEIEAPSTGSVVLRGTGSALGDGYLVVGGNLTRSTGGATPVSCNAEGCLFGLLLAGESGDEIDLFLTSRGSRAGSTDVQTVVLP